ncbi:hypothetical protein BpHYR1_033820, partial [Brachionus plicatilis]
MKLGKVKMSKEKNVWRIDGMFNTGIDEKKISKNSYNLSNSERKPINPQYIYPLKNNNSENRNVIINVIENSENENEVNEENDENNE